MRERGAGRGTMTAGTGPVLDAPTAALVRVAAAVARGNGPELKARFAAARGARVPGRWIEELLLQSMLVVGYPLALVALAGRGGARAMARETWRRPSGSRGRRAARRRAAGCTGGAVTSGARAGAACSGRSRTL